MAHINAGVHLEGGAPLSMPRLPHISEDEDAVSPEEVAQLRARVQDLEMEAKLMQQELDGITQEAQRADSQLRYIGLSIMSEMPLTCQPD